MSAIDALAPTRRRPRSLFPLLLIAPAAALLVAVLIYPLIGALADAFFDSNLLYPDKTFVGLENIGAAFTGEFWELLGKTLAFALPATVAPFAIGLVAALGLNQRMRGRAVLRSVLLFPWVLPGVVVSFLWLWIFDANYGVLNGILRSLGVIGENIGWLDSGAGAMTAVVVARTWASFPWMMVMLLAALQSFPGETYEAARMDGAHAWQRFRYITVPGLMPVATIVVLLEFIWNFQQFDLLYVLTGGGPAGATTTFSLAVYETAFKGFDLGMAGALGILWMLVLLPVVLLYLRGMENEK
ncbi:carbohydrate ABC transporter permease [Microbacterium sp. RU33B]|uniref:carbohydrate ABC transporter permease n=1 Tax=Microbacterium sp. RU33B TaxID=1907390 RepID=UPI00096705E5|nr:sugar ABC transporter permease [Microbacterium sp. RU33B]SIT89753.1 carbohydrate ABC transporter membrane protein 1, CUT1 family [Microbacterium sp. RU33B]